MSDDTISAEELARWKLRAVQCVELHTHHKLCSVVESADVLRLIRAYEAAVARIDWLESRLRPAPHSLGELYRGESERLRQQLAACDKQIGELQRVNGRLDNALERSGQQLAARDAEIARLTDCIIEARRALEAAGRPEGERLATGVAALVAEIARLRSVIEGLQREAAVAARDQSGVE